MNVLFLTQTAVTGASARYRVYQYLDFLEKNGIHPFVAPAISDELAVRLMRSTPWMRVQYYLTIMLRRLRDILRVRSFDVVFLQRDFLVHSYPVLELIIARLQHCLVFDVDDAIWLLPSGKQPGPLLRLLNDDRKAERIARNAISVIAGNQEICEQLRPFARAIEVIPTSIDLDRFDRVRNVETTSLPVIGWMGSPLTLRYVEEILPALTRLHERGGRFVLRVIGAELMRAVPFPVQSRPWSLETEVDELFAFDIGIMPLSDDPWSRAKSGTKLLQYMAAGVPAIASPVGMNVEAVCDGENGYLAATLQDWEMKLEVLIGDSAMRNRLGQSGRASVEQRYSTAVSGPKLLAVLNAAISCCNK